MDEQVWVGPAALAPANWTRCESLEVLLASSVAPQRIAIEDRPAMLREADFLSVYERFPLAQIERRVGPWRAGIGRTDPVWPLVTTLGAHSDLAPERPWRSHTSGYDERVVSEDATCLAGISVGVEIADPNLREMWRDALVHAEAELIVGGAMVLVTDEPDGRPETTSQSQTHDHIVRLRPDPWNATEDREGEIIASVLDSPFDTMQRIARYLNGGAQ